MPGSAVLGQRDGVVEVAGIDRVDRNHGLAGEIFPAVQVVLAKLLRLLARFRKHVFREFVRQSERANDRQRIDLRLAARPQNLGDNAFAALFRRGKAKHLDDDLVLRAHALGARVADIDAMAEDGAIHADQSLAVTLEVSPDELARHALQHLEDFARGAQIGPARLAGNANEHLVSGRGILGVLRPDHDLRPGVAVDDVRPHEPCTGGSPPVNSGHRAMGLYGSDGVILTDLDTMLLQ